jgi:hypothetical protein
MTKLPGVILAGRLTRAQADAQNDLGDSFFECDTIEDIAEADRLATCDGGWDVSG